MICFTIIAVALAAAAGLTAVNAQQTGTVQDFPFYDECSTGPFPYKLSPFVYKNGNNTFCFSLFLRPVSGCTDACCMANIKTLELNVKPGCYVRGANVSVAYSGPARLTASMDQPAQAPSGGTILRISGLSSEEFKQQSDQYICITLHANAAGEGCVSMEDFCKPPEGFPDGFCRAVLFDSDLDCCPQTNLQVPADSVFPSRNCKEDLRSATPFGVQNHIVKSPGKRDGTTRYCFNTTGKRNDVTEAMQANCPDADILSKVELNFRYTLRHAVKALYVKPADATRFTKRPTSWAAGATSNALKFAKLNWTTAQAEGGSLCVELDNLYSLQDLCMAGYCKLSFFNPKMNCCPTSMVLIM